MRNDLKNTDKVGSVPKAIKECAGIIVKSLLENDEETGLEFKVYPDNSDPISSILSSHLKEKTYNIQVPTPHGIYVNKVSVPEPLDDTGIKAIETRMAMLAKDRDYPTGSFFVAPWAEYLIHGGTIGRI